MTGLPAANVQLVVMDDSRVSSAAARCDAVQFGLSPVRCLEVEYNNVGEMLPMLVLATENEQLATLPETCGMTFILLA